MLFITNIAHKLGELNKIYNYIIIK